MVHREGKLSKTQDGKRDPEIPRHWGGRRKRKLSGILEALRMQLHDDLSKMREPHKLQKSKLHDERIGLSPGYRIRLLHRNKVQVLRCARCGEEIHVGDLIHVQHRKRASLIPSGGLKPLRVYHQKCWENMFLEC